MHRFYIEAVTGDEAVLDGAQLHHLRDVLRLKVGDSIDIFDSQGKEYTGEITGLEKKQARLKITAAKSRRDKKTRITVACAIPKGKDMDDIVDYLTQIGADTIIPMMTERVVVRLDEAGKYARRERWGKIALNAAGQSQRNDIPHIGPVTEIAKVVSNAGDYDLKLIPNLAGERKPLKDILSENRPINILVLIGPEGDFTPEEVQLALNNGFVPVSLGETVLRVATAAIAVTSYIRLALEE